ncbi:MAG: UbiA-like polyprenyltransferase [Ferruginibacter sp.]
MPSTTIKKYLSLVKFSHTIFAMPFALIGFFLGVRFYFIGERQWNLKKTIGWNPTHIPGNDFEMQPFHGLDVYSLTKLFLLVIICMITARSAAMAFNRYLDSHFDAKNPRTAIREIPAGIISKENALRFVIINCVVFVMATFFINRICFYLSPVALFVILFYSYTKRFTALCHLVLGVGLSLAPIGAYLAVTGQFDVLPVLFSFTVLFWVSGFDIIYALQDEGFDRSQNLHSIPAALGKSKALRVSELLHLLSAACVISAGLYAHFSWLYWVGTAVFAGMLIYQHSIVKPTDLSKVNIAFMTANGIASVIFSIFVLLDIFINH